MALIRQYLILNFRPETIKPYIRLIFLLRFIPESLFGVCAFILVYKLLKQKISHLLSFFLMLTAFSPFLTFAVNLILPVNPNLFSLIDSVILSVSSLALPAAGLVIWGWRTLKRNFSSIPANEYLVCSIISGLYIIFTLINIISRYPARFEEITPNFFDYDQLPNPLELIYYPPIFLIVSIVSFYYLFKANHNRDISGLLTRKRKALLKQFQLSHREEEISLMVQSGLSNKEISQHLNISYGTVKNHIHSIFQKTGVENRRDFISLWENETDT